MKGRIKRLTSLCTVAVLATASLSINMPTVKAAGVAVNVNFSQTADYPLVKNKVSPFNSGYEGLLDDVRIYNYVIPEGLIQELSGDKFLNGQYHFDSISNAKSVDSSDKQNDINLYGNVATTVGQKGNAIVFNGSSYGTLTRNIADDFTIGFWVKTTQTTSGTQWYEGAGLIDGECPEVTNDFGVSLLNEKLAFGTGRPDVTIKSNTSINDGDWHYCTVTRERPSGKMSLYVDGVKEAETIGGKKSLYTPLELDIGRIHNSTTNYFNGSIDELVIYNRAFSDNEVKVLANGELK